MPDEANGRITIAILSQQIQTLTAEVASLRADVRELSKTAVMDMRSVIQDIADYRVIQSRHDTQITNLGQDCEAITNRVNAWSAVNSIAAVLAGIVGVIFGTRQP